MTQPFTSFSQTANTQLPSGKRLKEDDTESLTLASSTQPAIIHPNFDPKQTPLDPARPLSDIPEPARRANGQLHQLYGKAAAFSSSKQQSLSKWQLIASKPLAEHLSLLKAAKLIELPNSFYQLHIQGTKSNASDQTNSTAQPLLSSLEQMTLLDMADIQQAISHLPKLTRYGFSATEADSAVISTHYNPDELLNSLYADDWQVVLQPEDFETGEGSLATDIMACSVAVHALKQCATRKTTNQSYTAEQICQHLRSYLLSQIYHSPSNQYHYRQIRLFAGHVIVAAYHLGWDIQLKGDGQTHFNISSRCSLLTRYANMSGYYINGWSSE